MSRPRWHDVLIVTAIALIVGYGAWALWWGDVREGADGMQAPTSGSAQPASSPALDQGPQT
jgi:hypothetical protein